MFYVVCYDVSEDIRREHLSKRLLNFGTRIQDSVFECVLDEDGYARMMYSLQGVKLASDDKVRVYRLCAPCVQMVHIYGPGDITHDPEFYLV